MKAGALTLLLTRTLGLPAPVLADRKAAASAPAPATTPPLHIPVGTVVPALPANCAPAAINSANYSYCDGVYYRAGFQGNNVVYVVTQP